MIARVGWTRLVGPRAIERIVRMRGALPWAAPALLAIAGPAVAWAAPAANDASTPQPADPVDLVDPFIGTGGHGHTFPGATLPFGMVQLSPDTRLEGWDGCSGYHFSDDRLFGFSHTHLSGTGVPDYCDVLVYPSSRSPRWLSAWWHEGGYGSRFEKATESASPGYYAVTLAEEDVRAELTTTLRAGLHRYTFPAADESHLLVDLTHRDETLEASIRVVGPTEIEGHRISRSWAREQRIYFVARASKPFRALAPATAGATRTERPAAGAGDRGEEFVAIEGPDSRAALVFSTAEGEQVLLKVGISAVSTENARRNLEAEIPDWDFDRVRRGARQVWREALGRIEIEGGSREDRVVFYTALYHAILQPNLFTDVNGEYRGRDGQVHRANGHTQYTVFSLWDTFRAAHPLYTILEPARTVDFIRTMLAQYREGGLLPVWELAGNETLCMIGYHAVSVIADAYAKGIRGFDAEEAWEAMTASAGQDHLGLAAYRAHGYIPFEEESESVSKTLEYAYDDWCIATVAEALGKSDERDLYLRRAQSWKNLFDPETAFFRPKSGGRWKSPFRPTDVDVHYTEANAWQYAFFVPDDVEGLIDAVGGPAAFVARLDSLFEGSSETTGRKQADITGLIGQYAHGNEPSHHVAYLYAFAGAPWKTQARVDEILSTLYAAAPDGLSGNEDCGQMSSWYVLSALGFYSVTPGQDTYVIGTPRFDRATIHLENGNRFTITARRSAPRAPYVQSATWNGAPFTRSFLRHGEILAGGELHFELGPEPNPAWGAGAGERPSARVSDPDFLPVPFVQRGEPSFRDSTVVALALPAPFYTGAEGASVEGVIGEGTLGEGTSAEDTAAEGDDAEIVYTLDGTEPTSSSPRFEAPVVLRDDAIVRFAAARGTRLSAAQSADFRRLEGNRSVVSTTVPSPLYPGGSREALVDGIRGGPDFRLGAWQGFEGEDLELVVDLGAVTALSGVSLGCLQDENSWIFFPSRVQYEISRDGQDFVLAGEAGPPVDPRAAGALLAELEASFPATEARYIRVRATSLRACPEWHKGRGQPCWVFVDEIIVR